MPKEKRERKVVHPQSRLAAQRARKASHDQKVDRRYKEKSHRLEVIGDKLKWFKDHLDETKPCYTKQEVCQMVEQYLDRFEDELAQIELLNSMKGRSGQHVARQQAIKMTLEKERLEYSTSGFEVPDIINTRNCQSFRDWTGQLRYVQTIKMKKVTRSDRATNGSTQQKDAVGDAAGNDNKDSEHGDTESISSMDSDIEGDSVDTNDKIQETNHPPDHS